MKAEASARERFNSRASRTGPAGGRPALAVVLITTAALGVSLGGCGTIGVGSVSPTTETEDNQLAASPANIASLTEVVQRNPNDAQAYNMRGSVLGRAGRNQEALADFDHAIADYSEALRVGPRSAVILTNRGIADALVVTVSTVEFHLASTYRKLGIASRRELAGVLRGGSEGMGDGPDRVAAHATDR